MKIAVMPNFLRNHIRRKQSAKAELQAVLQRQQLIDQREIDVPYRFAMPRKGFEDALGARPDLASPSHDVVGPNRIGRKIRNIVPAGEGQMHFGKASPGLRDQTQIGRQLLTFTRPLAGREQPLLVDKAVEIARSYCPAVPLILNKRMDDTDSAVLVVLDNLAPAQQSGCVGA